MRRVDARFRFVLAFGLSSMVAFGALAATPNESTLDKARDFIRTKHFAQAVDLLAGALASGPPVPNASTLELFGEALVKAGQYEKARAALNDYLRFYPDGEGAARVKLRLGALPRQTSHAVPVFASTNPSNPDEMSWRMSGGVSSYFIRDDSYNTAKDVSIAPNVYADPDAHRLHQNTFLTTFDELISIKTPEVGTRIKISGIDEHRMRPGEIDSNNYGFSQAFIETTFPELGVTTKVGRQTRNAGGVLGRFDGALASWRMNPVLGFNAVVGAANNSRYDAPFKDRRIFGGVSVDIRLIPNFDLSVFAIQQNVRSLLDRRAIGGEFRYLDRNVSALGMVDYDVHFNRFNAATLSTSYTFDDGSAIAASFDHRRVPYLASVNALQGQPFLTLYDMLKFNSEQDVRNLAIDRTPYFQSAMTSYARRLNEKLSFNVDATTTFVSGTLPSGGVDGSKPLGREYYLSGQLIANDIYIPGDLYTAGVRYARLADSNVYFLDLDAHYPVTEQLRISPRLRVGYREGRKAFLRETTVLPSFLFDYFLTKTLALEAEVAVKRIDTASGNIRGTTKDFFFTLGLRSEFSNEGIARCAGLLTPCLTSMFSRMPARSESALSKDGPASVQNSPAFSLEVGARYWFSRGRIAYDYFANDTPTQKVSRLDYERLLGHTGELFFRADAFEGILGGAFIQGYVDAGILPSGRFLDRDYPVGDAGSFTKSATSGRTGAATIDLGYDVYANERLRLGVFVGWQTLYESLNAKGCAQFGFGSSCVPPIPTSIRVVSEHDRFSSLRVGMALDVMLTDRLTWSSQFAVASISHRATDTHYFTFGADPALGRGGGVEAETALKYAFDDRLTIGAGFRWRHLSAHSVDLFGQLLQYQIDHFGVFVQASYRFSWGDLVAKR